MRRSIQIASACAFLVAAAGPVTGYSDSLAAEGETLPCNDFCRTWMGYEAGVRVAPQTAPTETDTAKPSEVLRGPEPPVDRPASESGKPMSASKTDGGGKPSHPKPKRNADPETADVSDHRSAAARSKTTKLAKRPKTDNATISDTRSAPDSPSRPRVQAEENPGTLSVDRRTTSSEHAKVTVREVPLPPRLPRAARPSRTGVAQAGQNAADEMRVGVFDQRSPDARASSKVVRNVTPTSGPGRTAAAPSPQADVPHAAIGSSASAASKTGSKPVDGVSTGLVGDRATARSSSLAGLNVTPAVDPREGAQQVAPQAEHSNPVTPDSAEAVAKPTPSLADRKPVVAVAPQAEAPPGPAIISGAAVANTSPNIAGKGPAIAGEGTAVAEASSPASRAVPLAPDPDKDAARVAAQPASPPEPAAKSGAAVANTPPNIAGQEPAVAGDGTAVAEAPFSGSRSVPPAPDPDKDASRVAAQAEAPTAPAMDPGAAVANPSPTIAGKGPAVAGAGMVVAEGRAVPPASDPDRNAVRVAAQAEVPSRPVVDPGAAVANPSPTIAGKGPAVADAGMVVAGASSSAGRVVPLASNPDTNAARVAAQAEAPPRPLETSGTAVAGASSPIDRAVAPASDLVKAPASIVSQAEIAPPAVMGSGEASSTSTPNTVGKEPMMAAGTVMEAPGTSAATFTGAAQAERNDDPAHPAALAANQPAPTLTGPSVPEKASGHHDDVLVAARNEPHAAGSEIAQSPLASPDGDSRAMPDTTGKADRPAPAASSQIKAPVTSAYGALENVDAAHQATSNKTASLVTAPTLGAASADGNPATLATIATGDVSTEPEGTTVAYTITNPAAAPIDILFIRCNAVDPKGTVTGSAFDYVENVPAGQQVKRIVRMPSDIASSGQTFSCANDAVTQ